MTLFKPFLHKIPINNRCYKSPVSMSNKMPEVSYKTDKNNIEVNQLPLELDV